MTIQRHSFAIAIGLCAQFIACGLAWGLASDRDKPAIVEADEVEMDFNTGQRVYKGNVIIEQGTLLIKGDKMIIKYKDDQMETATAWGNPATFKQRPDNKDEDVLGKGRKIILNQIEDTLTLVTSASLKQGGDWANGEIIVYNMGTDKMTVKSTGPGKKAKTDEPGKKQRARIIIMPSKDSKLAPSPTTPTKKNSGKKSGKETKEKSKKKKEPENPDEKQAAEEKSENATDKPADKQ